MDSKKMKFSFNKINLWVLVVLLLAVTLLWQGNANSMQAEPALVAGVYFDGEYRIAGGQWQKIVEGNHIPSTEGDVTLRGNFHMVAPDGWSFFGGKNYQFLSGLQDCILHRLRGVCNSCF